ncbi:hypothetical protein [Thermogemmatispora sp.]|uniref:hypothetical protein n=1 Tax=Thermogemmatispora sp. TaxID=1968838 RepID=UPI0035E3F7F4
MAQDIVRPVLSNCPECGGERVLAESVSTMRITRPGAAYLPGLTHSHSDLWALTCLKCGLITLYAKNPSRLADKA